MPNTKNTDTEDDVIAARGTPGQSDELRQVCPRWILNVLDACSINEDITRTELVNRILGDFAKRELHRSMLVQRIAAGNTTVSDTAVGMQ